MLKEDDELRTVKQRKQGHVELMYHDVLQTRSKFRQVSGLCELEVHISLLEPAELGCGLEGVCGRVGCCLPSMPKAESVSREDLKP